MADEFTDEQIDNLTSTPHKTRIRLIATCATKNNDGSCTCGENFRLGTFEDVDADRKAHIAEVRKARIAKRLRGQQDGGGSRG